MTASEANRQGGYAPAGKDTGRVKPKGSSSIRAHCGIDTIPITSRKPSWLKVRSPGGPNYLRLKSLMRSQSLHTVCEEAGCPNIGECWEAGTATFMILGDVCTRACKYCAVAHGMPTELDLDEPRRVADTIAAMDLDHAVITSVNRDELADGGASIYAATIREVRARLPHCSVEVLIPDFKGDEDALRTVMDARPAILGHNLETVERLHPEVRPGGRYWRSISYLGSAKRIDASMLTKTGIILGMGERANEIRQAMADLREAAVDILTLGQYLRPSAQHIPVARWVTPGEFADWKRIGEAEYGFRHVESGPLVRSSYHAKEQAREVEAGGPGKIQEVMEADVPAPAENPNLVGNGAAGAGHAAPGGAARHVPQVVPRTAENVPRSVPRPSKYVPRYLESVPRPENGSSERTNEPSEMNGGARAPALIQLRRQGRSTARAQGTGG
ncbi:MAG: lipoyl synthase [Gemmatimonadota bacterium]|nr:lipoyl synthase [Gemmatimonadota bacterium]